MRQVAQDTAKLAAHALWPLSDADLTDNLRITHHLEQSIATLKARMVHEADTRGLPARQGHRSITSWTRDLLRLDPQPARDLTDHATTLAQHPQLQQAVLDAQIDLRQATAIAATITAIPTDLATLDQVSPTDTRRITDQARTTLIELAAQFPAHQLRHAGQRILTHVAPHLADQAEQAALTRQHARNQPRRGITLSLPADGLVRLSGLLTTEDAATVHAALHPLCTPTPSDTRPAAHRRADALIDICHLALRTGELPTDGGEPPQVNLTVAYDPLTHALGAGTTDTGTRLPADTTRRMACDAKILPIILSGDGQILDAGRTRRLATGPLRRALHIRDQGCTFPGCDRPPRWTDAHHITAWTKGGPTTLNNLALLCRHHHRLIHHPTAGWQVRLAPDHHPEFLPPPTIDPQQQPRRNLLHLRQ